MAGLAQLVTAACRAPVLPDNGVGDGLAGLAVPEQGGFALVGDAYGRHLAASRQLLQAFTRHRELAGPDLQPVMLNLPGFGKYLAKLFLRQRHNAARVIKQNGTRTGRALVKC